MKREFIIIIFLIIFFLLNQSTAIEMDDGNGDDFNFIGFFSLSFFKFNFSINFRSLDDQKKLFASKGR
jgi:hypothetical protein